MMSSMMLRTVVRYFCIRYFFQSRFTLLDLFISLPDFEINPGDVCFNCFKLLDVFRFAVFLDVNRLFQLIDLLQ